MTVAEHLDQQPAERRATLRAMHDIIIKNDSTVTPTIGSMMGKEMIFYNCQMFKYGLASAKDYMSLHCMPIYMNPELHAKYLALVPKAKVQKGCINFKNEMEMPLDVTKQLIADCAKIDIDAILAARKKK